MHLLRSALVMLTSSLFQNFNRGARDFIVHFPFRSLLLKVLGTSCSISELRHDEESSACERARLPPRKLTHPHPSESENIVGLLSFLYFFLSFRFRTHLDACCWDFGMVTTIYISKLRRNSTIPECSEICEQQKKIKNRRFPYSVTVAVTWIAY